MSKVNDDKQVIIHENNKRRNDKMVYNGLGLWTYIYS